MSKRLIAVLGGVLAIALIVAGCGGGSNSTDSTASLTKAEFIKQGNAICATGNKQIEAGFESFAKENNLSENKQPTEAQAAEVAETVLIPAVTTQIEGIRALGAPSGDEDQVNAILEAAEEGVEKAEEDPGVLVSSNGENAFGKANKLSREYGLTTCGEE